MINVLYKTVLLFIRKLSLDIMESTLSTQLHGVTLPRLHHLHITGQNLATLHPNALSALWDCRQLVVELSNTQVQDIPSGFFTGFSQTAHFSIDLRDNALLSLSPLAFYSNATSWDHVGTKQIVGKSKYNSEL